MASKIQSQENAIKFVDKVLSNYMASQGKVRPHFIISGPSGTGKSFILEKLCRKHAMSFLNINAAQLTREGIAGNSLSKALEPLKKLQGKPVVVLCDEFDKLFQGVNGATGDERAGVQSEILHIVSSGVAQVIADYGHYHEVNTSNVLFIFAGAFQGQTNLSPEKLLNMGMYPELLGRVNLHIELPSIECDELIKAMKKDDLLQHYANIHKLSKEKLEEATDSIAEQIRKQFPTNVIGYRLITRLIHQYFLFDGVFPEYKMEEGDDLLGDDLDKLQEELGFETQIGD